MQQLFLKTNNCPDIFEDIDKRIVKEASKLLDNIRFGMDKKVNLHKAHQIIDLKNILTSKVNCSNNFSEYEVSFLYSLI